MADYVIGFESLRMTDVPTVGGKNASLGEMISQLTAKGVRVPGGFATTAEAYREFLAQNGLAARINAELDKLDVEDVTALVACGKMIRQWIMDAPFPARLQEEIAAQYQRLVGSDTGATFAVRSSATAEDLPDASFAGQQETFLNIHGLDNILHAIKEVFASLYNDRAISYRVHKGFVHADVALSAGIQKMVRSDIGASGVMFTIDTESGFPDVVFITAAYGLGETVVQGAVNPDEFYVHKPLLAAGKPAVVRRSLGSKLIKMVFTGSVSAGKSTHTVQTDAKERSGFALDDAEVLELARYAVIIEEHYQRPMDIEWGRDGNDGKIYILQARPETVKSQAVAGTSQSFNLKQHSKVLTSGRAIGQKIGQGPVRIIESAKEMLRVEPGDVLVTDMTDPDWEPVMKRASAIVTNRGGRTCHAAIIARELGIPAVVGCGDATENLVEDEVVTVSCAEGDTGYVYKGALEYEVLTSNLTEMPPLPTKIMMNVGNPDLAFSFAQLPNAGVGLARLEFVINNMIGVHPKAILDHTRVRESVREEIERRSRGYASPRDFYIEKLAEGVATLGAAYWPKPVIVRMSDFKSNEYRKLIGGDIYEPEEENPMLGFRGASRYAAESFVDCFEMECLAMRKVRDEIGLTNVELMIPFVRTIDEARAVIDVLAKHGLKRGENGLRLIMMCEIPSNALLAEQFLELFDGFSIGSNDLTQLTLGLDRDSALVASAFDERNPAVKALLSLAISACRRLDKYVGICGQGPSDHPDLAEWLMAQGISSISLNPDTVVATWERLGKMA
ncbi:pyruvate, water dikinase [Novimethylophilus kurashikiensis]|uniref:Phosphoenolpyruvate synthase n=1 Tax=Novimethylophilus kurashikiensis TaxID=1825523 RepID=A0A2R5F8Z9_9PROT|nr:phosphoenolpyruvate synthase [Novimethylophilus kurashikiensis]GBG14018.1 pyruvate, water dikinase [Novimethylophilus kurashikiensis]